jgi:hypothetical protein
VNVRGVVGELHPGGELLQQACLPEAADAHVHADRRADVPSDVPLQGGGVDVGELGARSSECERHQLIVRIEELAAQTGDIAGVRIV